MTNDVHVLSVRQRLGRTLAMGALFFLVYGGVNAYTASRESVPSLFFAWETAIPFLDWMIVPYMALDVLFVGAFLLCRERREMNVLSARIALAILSSAAGFLLFPLQFAFPKPDTAGLPGVLFHWLALDLPYNQCPSLHVSLSLIIGAVYVRAGRAWCKLIAICCFVLTAVATVFVYQHHVIDLIGGALVGLYVGVLLPARPYARHQRLALRYAGLGIVALLPAVWLQGWAWVLLYPALSCGGVAWVYARRDADAFAKAGGRHSWPVRLLFGPYLLGSWLNVLYYRLRDKPWQDIAPGLVLGRRLTAAEARRLIAQGVTAVLDLAPELSEPRNLTRLHYRHIPMLDLLPPESGRLEAAVAFIRAHVGRGKVYVHCALGYSRSALVAALYLNRAGLSAEAAVWTLRNARPRVLL